MLESTAQKGGGVKLSSQSTAPHNRLVPEIEEFTSRVRKLEESGVDYDHWYLHEFASFTDIFTRVMSPTFAADEVKMAITQLWHLRKQLDGDFLVRVKAKEYFMAFVHITIKIQAVLLPPPYLEEFKLECGAAVTLWDQYWGKDPFCRAGSCIKAPGVQNPLTQGLQAVLVRPEYEAAHQAIQDWQRHNPTGGMTITGHDGIGKSLFIFYLLVLRLSQEETIIFQGEPDYYTLFCLSGVYRIPSCKRLETFGTSGIDISPGTWALVDPNECDFGHPTESQEKGLPFFVIEATSSQSDRRSVWVKEESTIGTFFMKPWSREEIMLGCSIQHVQYQPSGEELDRFYHNYGPLPRVVYGHSGLMEYTTRIGLAIRDLRWSHLLNTLKSGVTRRATGWSNQLLLVEPAASDNRSDFRVSVITWTVKKLLWEGLWDRSHPIVKQDAQEFFDLALTTRHTLALACWMLEFAVRDTLRKCKKWTFYRMVAIPLVDQIQTFTHSRTMRPDPVSRYTKRLNHPPLDPLNAPVLEPGFYYADSVLDQPAFPYFIYDPDDPGNVYLTIVDVAASYEPHTIDGEGLVQLRRFAQSKGVNAQRVRYAVAIDNKRPVELEVVVPVAYLALLDLCVLNVSVA